MLPFTRDQFFAIFVDYNLGVWPAQIVAGLLGLAMVGALIRPSRLGGRVIGMGLAASWLWTGVAYHGRYFSTINKAALVFAAIFVLQGLAVFFAGVFEGVLRFEPGSRGKVRWLSWALIAYAGLVYPLIGLGMGHRLAELPMFGITPCPVTIFSFGLLLATPRVPWWLLLISGLLTAAVLLRGRARQAVVMST